MNWLIWKREQGTETWMNLEDIMLSEIRQSQKDKFQIHRDRVEGEFPEAGGRGE